MPDREFTNQARCAPALAIIRRVTSSPPSSPVKPAATLSVNLSLALTTIIQALTSMASISVPVLAPVAAPELGLSPALVGFYVGFVYLGAALGALVAGGLALRFGPMRLSQVALLCCASGLALLTIVPVWLIPLSAILLGLGYGPITPASSQVLAKSTPPHLMARVFSIKQTGVPLGAVLAGALIPALTLGPGWRTAALSVAAACALFALIAQPWREAFDADRNPAQPVSLDNVRTPLAMVIATADRRWLVACSVVFAGCQMCLMTYLVTYLHKELGWTLTAAGFALSVATAFGVAGRIFWGVVADKLGSTLKILSVLGFSMGGFGLVAALWSVGAPPGASSWPSAAILLSCACFGATAIGWNGVHLAEMARIAPPGQAGVLTGGSSFFTYGGVVLAPPLFGLLHDVAHTFAWSFAVFALLPLSMGVALWLRAAKRSSAGR